MSEVLFINRITPAHAVKVDVWKRRCCVGNSAAAAVVRHVCEFVILAIKQMEIIFLSYLPWFQWSTTLPLQCV